MTSDQSAVQPTVPATSSSTLAHKPPAEPWLSPQVSSYFIAGGFAGAASRTVVSPLERLKIIQYVSQRNPISGSPMVALVDRFNQGTLASSIRECGEVSFACGKRRGSGGSCEGMGSIAFESYLTVPSNLQHMNNLRRCVAVGAGSPILVNSLLSGSPQMGRNSWIPPLDWPAVLWLASPLSVRPI